MNRINKLARHSLQNISCLISKAKALARWVLNRRIFGLFTMYMKEIEIRVKYLKLAVGTVRNKVVIVKHNFFQ